MFLQDIYGRHANGGHGAAESALDRVYLGSLRSRKLFLIPSNAIPGWLLHLNRVLMHMRGMRHKILC